VFPKQIHIQVPFRSPLGAGNVTEPSRTEHQRFFEPEVSLTPGKLHDVDILDTMPLLQDVLC
jgi:hypothetical protein